MKKHDHHQGLLRDLALLQRIEGRRQALRFLAGASLVPLVGCGGGSTTTASSSSSSSSGSSSSSSGTPGTCSEIPSETAGPYPGDGTNGPNALASSGIVRSDIRSSFGTMSGLAEGVLLTMKLTVVNTSASCAPLAGYAVYAWHCDKEGGYSLYTVANENYLRGVHATDENGVATFTTIFPGAYPGRWPHVHFEIFPSLAAASSSGGKVATSQLAFPDDACRAVYASAGYETSATNHPRTTLASDGVFRDGATAQLATVTGDVRTGYVAELTIGVSV